MSTSIHQQNRTLVSESYGPDNIITDCIRLRLSRLDMGRILREIAHSIDKEEISLDIRIWSPMHDSQPRRAWVSFDDSMGFTVDTVEQEVTIGRDIA